MHARALVDNDIVGTDSVADVDVHVDVDVDVNVRVDVEAALERRPAGTGRSRACINKKE